MIVPIQEDCVTFCAFSDASFTSSQRIHAHQGTIIFTTTSELLSNNSAIVCPIAWSSKKIPRVVKSTLGAEAIALCNTVDRLSWLRIRWAWLKDPGIGWQKPEEVLAREPTASAVTDCKSVYDLVTRTATPQCEEQRTTIECLLIRQRMEENCRLRWVASGAMLADCLTKAMDSSRLRECLKSGRYALFDEEMVLKERSDKRQYLKWVKEAALQQRQSESKEVSLYSSSDKTDFWRYDSATAVLERIHRVPRWERFTPIGVQECPVGIDRIGVERTTMANLHSGRRQMSHDIWVGPDAHISENEMWTGVTRFQVEAEKPKGQR